MDIEGFRATRRATGRHGDWDCFVYGEGGPGLNATLYAHGGRAEFRLTLPEDEDDPDLVFDNLAAAEAAAFAAWVDQGLPPDAKVGS